MNRLPFVIWIFPSVTVDACKWADGNRLNYAFEMIASHVQWKHYDLAENSMNWWFPICVCVPLVDKCFGYLVGIVVRLSLAVKVMVKHSMAEFVNFVNVFFISFILYLEHCFYWDCVKFKLWNDLGWCQLLWYIDRSPRKANALFDSDIESKVKKLYSIWRANEMPTRNSKCKSPQWTSTSLRCSFFFFHIDYYAYRIINIK